MILLLAARLEDKCRTPASAYLCSVPPRRSNPEVLGRANREISADYLHSLCPEPQVHERLHDRHGEGHAELAESDPSHVAPHQLPVGIEAPEIRFAVSGCCAKLPSHLLLLRIRRPR